MNSTENTDKVNTYKEVGHTRDIISDFRNYWCIFKRRWLPAVAVFSSVVALSTLYAFTQKPIYSAQGQLLFKQEDKAIELESAGGGEFPSQRMVGCRQNIGYRDAGASF